MIDLTPLDVRNKRGDFKKGMRGYDPQEVDIFLELVAERLEALVRENIQLRDRTKALQEQVDAQVGREKAVQDALVTAQELRKDIREQSQREADHLKREAESEAKRMIAEAEAEVRSRLRGVERRMDQARASLQELERRRTRFLQEFRTLLERELDNVDVEEGRTPLEDRPIDLELGSTRAASGADLEDDVGELTEREDDDSEPVEDEPGQQRAEVEVQDAGPTEEAPDRAGEASAPSQAPATESKGEGEGVMSAGMPPSDEAAQRTAEETIQERTEETTEARAEETTEVRAEETTEARTEQTADDTTVDVADLEPGASGAEVDDAPSSLELELMAGAVGDDDASYPDVPDLETVLAEAGMDGDEQPPAEEISPPPADHPPNDRQPEERLAFFDKDEKKRKKKG